MSCTAYLLMRSRSMKVPRTYLPKYPRLRLQSHPITADALPPSASESMAQASVKSLQHAFASSKWVLREPLGFILLANRSECQTDSRPRTMYAQHFVAGVTARWNQHRSQKSNLKGCESKRGQLRRPNVIHRCGCRGVPHVSAIASTSARPRTDGHYR
jgi:hypothetical protein